MLIEIFLPDRNSTHDVKADAAIKVGELLKKFLNDVWMEGNQTAKPDTEGYRIYCVRLESELPKDMTLQALGVHTGDRLIVV